MSKCTDKHAIDSIHVLLMATFSKFTSAVFEYCMLLYIRDHDLVKESCSETAYRSWSLPDS